MDAYSNTHMLVMHVFKQDIHGRQKNSEVFHNGAAVTTLQTFQIIFINPKQFYYEAVNFDCYIS